MLKWLRKPTSVMVSVHLVSGFLSKSWDQFFTEPHHEGPIVLWLNALTFGYVLTLLASVQVGLGNQSVKMDWFGWCEVGMVGCSVDSLKMQIFGYLLTILKNVVSYSH
ncbi:hypothetical protein NPIL_700121 [Nephila pilipes]|uniref:Uncharacterized protein n=1 Tax=Nephila pilipes TaxID=299642 RepID=A0A8X6TGS8_NEPPI|nr:hypothetical protein NPIL_700121 [Nephila pilipes]